MKTEAAQLLALLNPATRPAGVPVQPVKPTAPIEKLDFASALRRAGDQMNSMQHAAVQMSDDAKAQMSKAGVSMDAAAMEALAEAVTRAESAGATDVLLMNEQGGWRVQVPDRSVTAFLSPDELRREVVTGIDAAGMVQAAPTVKPYRLQL